MKPMTEQEKARLRAAVLGERGREAVSRLARDNASALEAQRAHLNKCRQWLADAEQDEAAMRENATFFDELLGGLTA